MDTAQFTTLLLSIVDTIVLLAWRWETKNITKNVQTKQELITESQAKDEIIKTLQETSSMEVCIWKKVF